MDIAELATRTGLSTRKLRYVFDQRVLPGTQQWAEGRGIPRSFTAFEAFGIALAALLLESGLKRGLVAGCLFEAVGRFGRDTPVNQIPLYQAFAADSAWLEVGDGLYLRLHGKGQPGVNRDFDTGWRPLTQGEVEPRGYHPLVRMQVDLTALRRRVGS
jgi:hypothetical protein